MIGRQIHARFCFSLEHGGGFYNNGTTTLTNTGAVGNFTLDKSNPLRNAGHGGGFTNAGGIVNLLANKSGSSDVTGNSAYGSGAGIHNTGGDHNTNGSLIDGNFNVMVTVNTVSGCGLWNKADSVANFDNTTNWSSI